MLESFSMKRKSAGVSPEMKEVARRIAERFGIRPLKPGEERPDDYYAIDRFTGRPIVKDPNAVVRKN